jgi:hypothetical protein
MRFSQRVYYQVRLATSACLDCHIDQHSHVRLHDMEQLGSVSCTPWAYRMDLVTSSVGRHAKLWEAAACSPINQSILLLVPASGHQM